MTNPESNKYSLTDEEILDAINALVKNFQTTIYHSDRRIADAATAKVLRLQAEEAGDLREKIVKTLKLFCPSCDFYRDCGHECGDTEIADQILTLFAALVAEAVKKERERIIEYLNENYPDAGVALSGEEVSHERD